jgi:Trypsin-like peptidase domain/Effector-associated domain 1
MTWSPIQTRVMSLNPRIRAWCLGTGLNLVIALVISLFGALGGVMPPRAGWAMGLWSCLLAVAVTAAACMFERLLRFRLVAVLLLLAVVVFVLTLGSYFSYAARVVWVAPNGDRTVKGTELTEDAKLLKEKNSWDDETLLEKAERWDPRKVYTPESISRNEWVLMRLWMAAVATFLTTCALAEVLLLKTLISDLSIQEPVKETRDKAMMPGVSFEEITNQIVDAYFQSELEMVLRQRMNVRLDRVVGPGTFDYVVFQLLSWAERQGREPELVRIASQARPKHDGMQLIYQKYGMAIGGELQRAGKELIKGPMTATGFEAEVKKYLPFLDPLPWREVLFGLEGRVCRVEVGNGTFGSGFLVGRDAVLTNYHVLEKVVTGESAVDKVRCRFDYKVLTTGKEAEGVLVKMHPTDWKIDASPYTQGEKDLKPDDGLPTVDELDYVLFRLERPIGIEPIDPNPRPSEKVPRRGWIKVPGTAPAITTQMPILILQHPRKDPLKLALDTEGVLQVNGNGTRVRYATNTAGGSSGSPCFDLKWNLIALHHYGDPEYNHPRYNQGVPIAAIRERLTRQGKADALGADPP